MKGQMVFTSFHTEEQAQGFASCIDRSLVKFVDVDQDSDGRWTVIYQPR